MRQQLLTAIYDGRPFRTVLRDLGLTSNQLWGLTKTDQEWATSRSIASASSRLLTRRSRRLVGRTG
jgi:hypothetical protein